MFLLTMCLNCAFILCHWRRNVWHMFNQIPIGFASPIHGPFCTFVWNLWLRVTREEKWPPSQLLSPIGVGLSLFQSINSAPTCIFRASVVDQMNSTRRRRRRRRLRRDTCRCGNFFQLLLRYPFASLKQRQVAYGIAHGLSFIRHVRHTLLDPHRRAKTRDSWARRAVRSFILFLKYVSPMVRTNDVLNYELCICISLEVVGLYILLKSSLFFLWLCISRPLPTKTSTSKILHQKYLLLNKLPTR